MALRIRKDGSILCAALNQEKEGDLYIDDNLHYYLSVIQKQLVTTIHEQHIASGGEWWWKGKEPKGAQIDLFYYL